MDDGPCDFIAKDGTKWWNKRPEILPAIHCLMTSKSQELYIAILDRNFSNLPNFKPMTVLSDWESAPRNSFKEIYPNININGCWFHYTQHIWAKVQKLGLTQSFHDNIEITKFVKQLMAIPFLPASLISPTYLFIQAPDLSAKESMKMDKLVKYFKRRWLLQTTSEELSIYEAKATTNMVQKAISSKNFEFYDNIK